MNTPSQERMIELIRENISRELRSKQEVKLFEVRDAGEEIKVGEYSFTSELAQVTVTVGMKGDEGTLAQSICRQTGIFTIRKGGGIELKIMRFGKSKDYVYKGRRKVLGLGIEILCV